MRFPTRRANLSRVRARENPRGRRLQLAVGLWIAIEAVATAAILFFGHSAWTVHP